MSFAAKILATAIVAGLGIGLGSLWIESDPAAASSPQAAPPPREAGRAATPDPVPAERTDLKVRLGPERSRPPQPGDSWEGCNAPRALGTAPIYRGEPGYDEKMDGDGDGVACEPHANQP